MAVQRATEAIGGAATATRPAGRSDGLRQRLAALASLAAAGLRAPATAGLLAAAALLAALLGARAAGFLEPLELNAYDRMVAWRAEASPHRVEARVAQVGVTEQDIARFGWPLSDGVLAAAIARLHAAGADAIGIDVFRPAPIGPGSEALARALAEVPELVWASRSAEDGWDGIAAPAAIAAAGRDGFSDMVLDRPGIARRALLYMDDGRTVQEAFPLRLALLQLARHGVRPVADASGFLRLGTVSLPPIEAEFGAYHGLDSRGYQVLREFRSPARLATYGLGALLDGQVPEGALKGRIVVLGITSDSVKDSVAAPPGGGAAMSGAAVHGLFAAQLVAHGLDGLAPTRPLPQAGERGAIGAAVLAGGLAGALIPGTCLLVLALLGGAAALAGACLLAFAHALWLPVVPLAGGFLLAGLVAAAVTGEAERAQRRVLMRLFSTHVSGPIAREIWRRRAEFVRGGRPVPMRQTATVLFSDINGFTATCERMEPEDIVRWLDGYMQAMTRLIEAHGGVVERFAGDGILAMFGVPVPRRNPREIAADAEAAVRCACRMRGALRALNEAARAEGLPETRVAVGIQTGVLVTCGLGGPERQQYTTMGDTTNTASRLVGFAKGAMAAGELDAECGVVIGEATRALLPEGFALRPIGAIELRGKTRAVECYAVGCGPEDDGAEGGSHGAAHR